jgi:hypothetical protein
MEDVLSVYQRPYDRSRPVVCLDETRKELHASLYGPLSPVPGAGSEPGRPARQDYGYERHGTASLFLWYEPLAGRRGVTVSDRHTGRDFAEALRHLADDVYPQVEQIVLVCDNLSTHTPASLYERFAPEEAWRLSQRFEWHYTPEHGSWLNVAECELSVLARQCLNRRLPDRPSLEREVDAWGRARNAAQAKTVWQFTAQDARIKLRRLYPKREEQNPA